MPRPVVPARYQHAVVPHAMVKDAPAAIAFYGSAFGAVELFRLALPNGHIVHAEMRMESSVFMVGEAASPFAAPTSQTPTAVGLHVYVQDVDALTARAVSAGAELVQPVSTMFYGDRQAMLRDPFGHLWVLLTHLEDLSEAEIVARARAFFAEPPA